MKLILTLLPLVASAAILPDAVGPYHRTATSQPAISDKPIWDEYGLKASETAAYENDKDKLSVTAWQLQDTTGALAAFDWLRPPDATASTAAKLAAETKTRLLVVHGNYVLSFDGYKPSTEELAAVTGELKNVDATALPVLASYLPSDGLVPNSERYVTGPAGLQKFDSVIPPSVAAFSQGAEAQIGVFHGAKGDATLAVFNYPTHQIAMQRIAEFEKLPGAVAKRSGPLVVVVLAPPDADFAERLLGQVRYQAEVTRDEYVPTKRDNIGVLMINAFILIGILLAFAVISGLAFGGFRAFRRRYRHGEEPEALVTLDLSR
jgi:hypothetical protein